MKNRFIGKFFKNAQNPDIYYFVKSVTDIHGSTYNVIMVDNSIPKKTIESTIIFETVLGDEIPYKEFRLKFNYAVSALLNVIEAKRK